MFRGVPLSPEGFPIETGAPCIEKNQYFRKNGEKWFLRAMTNFEETRRHRRQINTSFFMGNKVLNIILLNNIFEKTVFSKKNMKNEY